MIMVMQGNERLENFGRRAEGGGVVEVVDKGLWWRTVISRGEKVVATVLTCNLAKMAVSDSEADATLSPCLMQSSVYRLGRYLTKASENPSNWI